VIEVTVNVLEQVTWRRIESVVRHKTVAVDV